MSLSNRSNVSGRGTQVVELAAGADIIFKAGGPCAVLVGGVFQRKAWFRLPEDIDRITVECSDHVHWSLHWIVPKPAYEMLDPTPVALPIGTYHPEPLHETIARMVRHQVSQAAAASDFDTEEEEDYDPDEDDDDKPTRYEYEERAKRAEFDQAQRRHLAEYARKREAARRAKAGQGGHPPAEPTAPPVAPSTSSTQPGGPPPQSK